MIINVSIWPAHVPVAILSRESIAKVSIIRRIDKMLNPINGKALTVTEFDYLYDMPLKELKDYEAMANLNVEAEKRWEEYQNLIAQRCMGDQDCD